MSGDCLFKDSVVIDTMFFALEAGYAEPVVEQWQAWDKRNKIYFYITSEFNIGNFSDAEDWFDRERFNNGNYFPTRELAEQARDRILETLKEFHKEHKTQ